MGVWIEIFIILLKDAPQRVTPCMGVWIEIWICGHYGYGFASHSLYGSVDWNIIEFCHSDFNHVTPCMGVWIEIWSATYASINSASLPVWECGLKSTQWIRYVCQAPSLPVWECGLKSFKSKVATPSLASLPVWECGLKYNYAPLLEVLESHSLYGSVDWNCSYRQFIILYIRHSLYGSVDWNVWCFCNAWVIFVTPCMGVWIEIDIRVYLYSRRLVTPCMGVWIEILTDFTCHAQSFVTPCMGVWIEIILTPNNSSTS